MLRSGQYPDASTETKRGFVTGARVGIFFKIGDDWLVDSTQVASGEAYGDAVQHGGHYEYWESATPGSGTLRRFTTHDYDYFPRGRVVFFPRGCVFRVYVDNCLTQWTVTMSSPCSAWRTGRSSSRTTPTASTTCALDVAACAWSSRCLRPQTHFLRARLHAPDAR